MKARAIRLFLAVVAFSGVLPVVARAAVGGAGTTWTLQAVNTGRTCSLRLRFDPAGAAGGLTIPAGCRQAIPALRKALLWSIGRDAQISFETEDRQNLLTFTRQPDGTWQATAVDGTALMLTSTGKGETPAAEATAPDDPAVGLAKGQPVETPKSAKSAAPSPASAQALAGRYAVLRGSRDTGCMITLDTTPGRDGPRARLAPACRDQGITIFDPVNWHAKGSALVLTARKGHSISLDRDESGVWVKMPKDAKALALKPL